jgi:hypothetical protein
VTYYHSRLSRYHIVSSQLPYFSITILILGSWYHIFSSQLPYFSLTICFLDQNVRTYSFIMDENNNIHHTSISDISWNWQKWWQGGTKSKKKRVLLQSDWQVVGPTMYLFVKSSRFSQQLVSASNQLKTTLIIKNCLSAVYSGNKWLASYQSSSIIVFVGGRRRGKCMNFCTPSWLKCLFSWRWFMVIWVLK